MALLAPEAWPSSRGQHRGEDDVGHRGEEERHPDPRDHEAGDELGVGHRRRRDRRQPAEPDRLQREPGRHQRPAADAVGERAGDRRDEDRHRRPRQDAQAGVQRAVALHGLQELRQQEDRAEHPEEHEERGQVRRRERAAAEEAHRQHRRGRAELPEHEGGRQHGADGQRADDLGARPADRVAAHEAPDDPEAGRCSRGRDRAGRAAMPGRRSPSGGSRRAGSGRARSARSARRSTARRCPRRRRRR